MLELYLSDEKKKNRVICKGAESTFHATQAGVPKSSILGPVLYILYIVYVPIMNDTTTAMFVDDTVIFSVGYSQVWSKW